jgi:hypothetical protein
MQPQGMPAIALPIAPPLYCNLPHCGASYFFASSSPRRTAPLGPCDPIGAPLVSLREALHRSHRVLPSPRNPENVSNG